MVPPRFNHIIPAAVAGTDTMFARTAAILNLSRFADRQRLQPCRRVGELGITLLEVMVALGIAAIVLVAVYRLQIQSLDLERIARFHTRAPMLAEELIADIELLAPEFPDTDSGDFGKDYPGYTWTLETRDVANLTDNSGRLLLKQIDIKVHLNDDEDLFKLRTYRLANPGS